MISKEEADAAIKAAKDALRNEPGMSWIGKSSLMKRAYYTGLILGLEAIGEKNAGMSAFPDLAETLWFGAVDDSFPSTEIGAAFESLKSSVQDLRGGIYKDSLVGEIEALCLLIRDNARSHEQCIREIDKVMSQILSLVPRGEMSRHEKSPKEVGERANNSDEIGRSLEMLEGPLRFLALLETSHLLGDRFRV